MEPFSLHKILQSWGAELNYVLDSIISTYHLCSDFFLLPVVNYIHIECINMQCKGTLPEGSVCGAQLQP